MSDTLKTISMIGLALAALLVLVGFTRGPFIFYGIAGITSAVYSLLIMGFAELIDLSQKTKNGLERIESILRRNDPTRK